jgi:hypothetical protein
MTVERKYETTYFLWGNVFLFFSNLQEMCSSKFYQSRHNESQSCKHSHHFCDEYLDQLVNTLTDECVTPESPRISRAETKKMKKAKKKKRKAEKSARKAGKRNENMRQARIAVYEQPVTVTSH